MHGLHAPNGEEQAIGCSLCKHDLPAEVLHDPVPVEPPVEEVEE